MLAGIVGVPNSGKSTFFKALTLKDVEIADYPFTTIKPNEGVGFVTAKCPCSELGIKCMPKNSECRNGIRMIPVKLLDVAGLVEGAHMGKGMGNQFLDDLRQASALIHVLDCSGKTNSDGKPAAGWDPDRTVHILENEIDYWIHGIVLKGYGKVKTISRMEKKPLHTLLAQQLSGLGIKEDEVKHALEKFSPETIEFASHLRKLSKPIIIAANKIDLPESRENFPKLEKEYKNIIPCSAECELALKEAAQHGLVEYTPGEDKFKIVSENLNEKQRKALEFIQKNVLESYGSTGVETCLNKAFFEMLDMIVVYPVENEHHFSDKNGNALPDAILLKQGSTTLDLARAVHTEIADRMICGIDARTKMKIGKEHVLKDRDVVRIVV
jgi:ribosome-binding ATPase YchF (GTP1/OBG family)